MEDFFRTSCEALLLMMGYIVTSFKALLTTLLNYNVNSLSIVNTAVTSVAVSLATLFFTMEAFSQMAQFRFERIEDAIRLGLKLVVAKIVIENTSAIIGGIYELLGSTGSDAMETALSSLETTISLLDIDIDAAAGDVLLGLGYLFLSLMLLIVILIEFCLFAFVVIQVVGVIFELCIHQVVGPIAISTLCNDVARSTGISFIKSYAATCLQFTVISVIFQVFSKLLTVLSGFSVDGAAIAGAGVYGGFFSFMMPLICMIVLCVSIGKASDITKRMFGA